ncbi:MAG: thiamine diphosphokinase [Clostridia bacterium]|nr:thiamine diphosphokinase [Clostridia bacterium]
MRAIIICGGEVYDAAAINIKEDDFVICADAGARHLKSLNITPDVLIGDFDTLKDYPEGIKRIEFPPEKDETDTSLAVDYAISKGYDEILVLGALGGRADHSLANVFLLKHILEKNAKGELFDGKNRVFLTDKDFTVSEHGVYVSLFPLFSDIEGLTIRGMKYPLDDYKLPQGSSLCVSNEVTDREAYISFKSGLLLVMICRD